MTTYPGMILHSSDDTYCNVSDPTHDATTFMIHATLGPLITACTLQVPTIPTTDGHDKGLLQGPTDSTAAVYCDPLPPVVWCPKITHA